MTDRIICVVGLGYVGLPLALAFGRTTLTTYGFDVNTKRIGELKNGIDISGEQSTKEIQGSKVRYTADDADIAKANFIIVAVPTPVNKANQPDLTLVERASEAVGRNLKKGSIVVYESTVYPGVTEDICAPILEKISGLKLGKDFKIGYSPERVNPGDKEHTLESIVKVVSGMDDESAVIIEKVYAVVCKAGVYRAKNIKTAEAAKVIENTQRDLNIALVNELSLIFHRIGIDTLDVLEAAGTKWNFLNFRPGLVGGHCIGVDPYYLVQKAEELGYHPQVITAGRRVNDYMPEFVAEETVRGLIEAGKVVQGAKVLVMGLTFKENVKDMRNSKIKDTINSLKALGMSVNAYDPLLDSDEVMKEFGVELVPDLDGVYDALIISVNHAVFGDKGKEVKKMISSGAILVDIKRVFPEYKELTGVIYKSL